MSAESSSDPGRSPWDAGPVTRAELEMWIAWELGWVGQRTREEQWPRLWRRLQLSGWRLDPSQRPAALCWAGRAPKTTGNDFYPAWEEWCYAQVARFARQFFDLLPILRIKHWTELHDKCLGNPLCLHWLRRLRPYCRLELGWARKFKGQPRELVEILCRLGTVSPGNLRAEMLSAWKRFQESPALWFETLVELHQRCPPLCECLPLQLRLRLLELAQQPHLVPRRLRYRFESAFRCDTPRRKFQPPPRSLTHRILINKWSILVMTCLLGVFGVSVYDQIALKLPAWRQKWAAEELLRESLWEEEQYAQLPTEAYDYANEPPWERTPAEMEEILSQLLTMQEKVESVTQRPSRRGRELVARADQDLSEARVLAVIRLDRPAPPALPESQSRPQYPPRRIDEVQRLRKLFNP